MIQMNRVYQHTQSWGLLQVAIVKTTQQPRCPKTRVGIQVESGAEEKITSRV